jgi:hypothetical protein
VSTSEAASMKETHAKHILFDHTYIQETFCSVPVLLCIVILCKAEQQKSLVTHVAQSFGAKE